MYKSLVTLRYAKALFLQAEEEKQAERVLGDVEKIGQIVKESPELLRALSHPVVSTSQKLRVASEVFEERVTPLMLRFIRLIIRNKREAYLMDIFRNYRDIFNHNRGIQMVRLTTAMQLGDREKEDIKALIRENFHARKVDFSEAIDPGIIGGFIIQVEDQLLDASVRRQLDAIRKTLTVNGNLRH
jgi:F-type H+-transporting ATPase subunit delta